MKYRCLIVDDEPPAHKVLENYISKLSFLELVGNCYDAMEAVSVLHTQPVDLIFLDINMPEISGLEMLKTLENAPAVILTTAYSEFALESYEYGVVDYLLKPIRFDRFLKAVNRVGELHKPPPAAPAAPAPVVPPKETSFFVKVDGIQHQVHFDELLFVEAFGNFVKLHLADQRLVVADTLRNMELQLENQGFLRIHKSWLVNLRKVDRQQGNRLFIGETELPIGNSYKQIVLNELDVK